MTKAREQSKITIERFEEIRHSDAPFTEYYDFTIESLFKGECVVKLPYDIKHVRPGGTICGPAMFALADYAMWLAVLSVAGDVPLAVTTNMNINFLRKPADTHLLCETRLIKKGKRLMVGEMFIRAEADEEPCAHATGTYSIPV